MSAILRPEFPKPPHRIPIRGASPEDVCLVANSVDLIFNLALGALQGQLENLAENLPFKLERADVYDVIRDARSDMLGRLEAAQDRLCDE
jgi:hypothetical protein